MSGIDPCDCDRCLRDRDRPISAVEAIPGDGELYLFSQDDLDVIASEWFVQIREHPDIDTETAEELTTCLYDHLTGAWMDAQHE